MQNINIPLLLKVFHIYAAAQYFFGLAVCVFMLITNFSAGKLLDTVSTQVWLIIALFFLLAIIISAIGLYFSSKTTKVSWFIQLFAAVFNLLPMFYFAGVILVVLFLPDVRKRYFNKDHSI